MLCLNLENSLKKVEPIFHVQKCSCSRSAGVSPAQCCCSPSSYHLNFLDYCYSGTQPHRLCLAPVTTGVPDYEQSHLRSPELRVSPVGARDEKVGPMTRHYGIKFEIFHCTIVTPIQKEHTAPPSKFAG